MEQQSSKEPNALLIYAREIALLLVIQTFVLLISWNALIYSIGVPSEYKISVFTAFYAILAFKALTFSYNLMVVKTFIASLYTEISQELTFKRFMSTLVHTMNATIVPPTDETPNQENSDKQNDK